MVDYIDNRCPIYNMYLNVITTDERRNHLERYIPEFIADIEEFKIIYNTENISFDKLDTNIDGVISDVFISTSSNDAITRYENFLNIKGVGTLEQRRCYIRSLLQKGNKLNEKSIKDIVNAITGSDCIVHFFGGDELDNPEPGNSLLRVQVLSPDNYRDYRYEDIVRVIKPLVPEHIKLSVVRFFATWEDVYNNFAGWSAIKNLKSWEEVKKYIPPQ